MSQGRIHEEPFGNSPGFHGIRLAYTSARPRNRVDVVFLEPWLQISAGSRDFLRRKKETVDGTRRRGLSRALDETARAAARPAAIRPLQKVFRPPKAVATDTRPPRRRGRALSGAREAACSGSGFRRWQRHGRGGAIWSWTGIPETGEVYHATRAGRPIIMMRLLLKPGKPARWQHHPRKQASHRTH